VEQEAVAIVIRTHLAQAFKFPSSSMAPTLLIGDHLIVDKRAYNLREPQRGDLVVFIYPPDRSKVFIKRVIGLPGETVELRNKHVLINGSEVGDSHAKFSDDDRTVAPRDSMAPFSLPHGSYFVVGDNRDRSYDSRFWGPVAREDLLGRARVIYFSWDTDASRVRWDRIGRLLE